MRHQSRLAWSRGGLLAFIDDAHGVCVTWLRCADGESWDWVPPVVVPYPSDRTPVLLSWSASNHDLAISDELGRVQIVAVGTDRVPKTHIVASAARDDRRTARELDRLVGSIWLQPSKNLIIPKCDLSAKPGAKPGAKPWESVLAHGPSHPLKNAGAFLAVNGNGMLRLLVQTPAARYVEFGALVPGARCVSHASFLPMGSDTLLAVLINDDDQTLMAYEIRLHWEPPETWSANPDFVTLAVHPVASVQLSPALDGGSAKFLQTEAPWDLQIFRTIGSAPQIEAWVVYPHGVVKFVVQGHEESLHEAFFTLYSASPPEPPAPAKVWQLQLAGVEAVDSQIRDIIVQRFQVGLVHADGRLSMKNLLEGNDVLQLSHAGLEFGQDELRDAAAVCLSPTGCCAAIIKPKTAGGFWSATTAASTSASSGSSSSTSNNTASTQDAKKRLRPPEPPAVVSVRLSGPVTSRDAVAKIGLAFATYYACVVFNYEQYDDILFASRRVLSQDQELGEFRREYYSVATRETQRLLNVSLGLLDDPQKVERLIVIPSTLQRWLTFLINLGTNRGWQRSPGCRTAWYLLHLQLLAFSIKWTMKRFSQLPKTEVSEASRGEILALKFHLDAILGPLKWATDLVTRITQELYDASLSESPVAFLTGQPNTYVALLSSTVLRYLLRFFLRSISSISAAAKSLAELESRVNSLAQRQAAETPDASLQKELRAKMTALTNYGAQHTFKKFIVQLQSLPVKLETFERMVVEVDGFFKAVASSHQGDVGAIDSELIRFATLPENLVATFVPRLMTSFQKHILATADVPAMYFLDTTWIPLDGTTYPFTVDGLRKQLILPTEDAQQCARCGISSVRSADSAKGTTQWLRMFQTQCVCGGAWLVEDPRKR